MEFLNPAALYGFFALPLLLVPYLIKGRPRRVLFSSLLLLADFSSRTHSRPWGRLRLPPIFFLQLLLLALLILALAEPVFSVRPAKIALVVDNSASMQTLEDGRSRFALAREEARALLGDAGAGARVDLYLTAPGLAPVGAGGFSPAEASALLATLQPLDVGEPAGDFGGALARLARERNFDRVFFATDHPGPGRSGAVRVVSVGRPKENLAIAAFDVTRSSLAASRLEARIEIANFSPDDKKVDVLLKGEGRLLARRSLSIDAGKSAAATFDGFASHPYYEAQIEPLDALALDNRRFAVPPHSRNLRILGISPRPESLATLRSIPGVSLEVVSPEAYDKSPRTGHALEIFHFSAPAALPPSHALLILPPEQNPLVEPKKAVSRPVITGWREPHPLTRYVNFALFRPGYGRALAPRVFAETIIESREGVLAAAGESQGRRFLVLGFDPLPYLGRQNLPMSVFTLNFLDWFFEGTGTEGKSTGEPLPAALVRGGGWIATPGGERLPLKPGAGLDAATYSQGIYRVERGKELELLAYNFHDPKESDLRDPGPILLQDQGGARDSAAVFHSLWPYLLMLSLLLLVLEWFLNPPAAPAGSLRNAGRAAR